VGCRGLADLSRLGLASQDAYRHARTGRWDLDGRLVGHDLDHGLVLAVVLARFDQQLDDLALDNALADVGQLELEGHGQYSTVRRIASAIRAASGRYSFSSVYGNGVSNPVTRATGPSTSTNPSPTITAHTSPPT